MLWKGVGNFFALSPTSLTAAQLLSAHCDELLDDVLRCSVTWKRAKLVIVSEDPHLTDVILREFGAKPAQTCSRFLLSCHEVQLVEDESDCRVWKDFDSQLDVATMATAAHLLVEKLRSEFIYKAAALRALRGLLQAISCRLSLLLFCLSAFLTISSLIPIISFVPVLLLALLSLLGLVVGSTSYAHGVVIGLAFEVCLFSTTPTDNNYHYSKTEIALSIFGVLSFFLGTELFMRCLPLVKTRAAEKTSIELLDDAVIDSSSVHHTLFGLLHGFSLGLVTQEPASPSMTVMYVLLAGFCFQFEHAPWALFCWTLFLISLGVYSYDFAVLLMYMLAVLLCLYAEPSPLAYHSGLPDELVKLKTAILNSILHRIDGRFDKPLFPTLVRVHCLPTDPSLYRAHHVFVDQDAITMVIIDAADSKEKQLEQLERQVSDLTAKRDLSLMWSSIIIICSTSRRRTNGKCCVCSRDESYWFHLSDDLQQRLSLCQWRQLTMNPSHDHVIFPVCGQSCSQQQHVSQLTDVGTILKECVVALECEDGQKLPFFCLCFSSYLTGTSRFGRVCLPQHDVWELCCRWPFSSEQEVRNVLQCFHRVGLIHCQLGIGSLHPGWVVLKPVRMSQLILSVMEAKPLSLAPDKNFDLTDYAVLDGRKVWRSWQEMGENGNVVGAMLCQLGFFCLLPKQQTSHSRERESSELKGNPQTNFGIDEKNQSLDESQAGSDEDRAKMNNMAFFFVPHRVMELELQLPGLEFLHESGVKHLGWQQGEKHSSFVFQLDQRVPSTLLSHLISKIFCQVAELTERVLICRREDVMFLLGEEQLIWLHVSAENGRINVHTRGGQPLSEVTQALTELFELVRQRHFPSMEYSCGPPCPEELCAVKCFRETQLPSAFWTTPSHVVSLYGYRKPSGCFHREFPLFCGSQRVDLHRKIRPFIYCSGASESDTVEEKETPTPHNLQDNLRLPLPLAAALSSSYLPDLLFQLDSIMPSSSFAQGMSRWRR